MLSVVEELGYKYKRVILLIYQKSIKNQKSKMNRKQHLETVLEESFKELGNDKQLIFFALALTHKTSGPSAIKKAIEKGEGYSEVMLLYDLENYLSQKFKLEKNLFV